MSAHITIALTIAIVVLVNAHIAVARSAPMLPSEYLMDKEADQLSNRMVIDNFIYVYTSNKYFFVFR